MTVVSWLPRKTTLLCMSNVRFEVSGDNLQELKMHCQWKFDQLGAPSGMHWQYELSIEHRGQYNTFYACVFGRLVHDNAFGGDDVVCMLEDEDI